MSGFRQRLRPYERHRRAAGIRVRVPAPHRGLQALRLRQGAERPLVAARPGGGAGRRRRAGHLHVPQGRARGALVLGRPAGLPAHLGVRLPRPHVPHAGPAGLRPRREDLPRPDFGRRVGQHGPGQRRSLQQAGHAALEGAGLPERREGRVRQQVVGKEPGVRVPLRQPTGRGAAAVREDGRRPRPDLPRAGRRGGAHPRRRQAVGPGRVAGLRVRLQAVGRPRPVRGRRGRPQGQPDVGRRQARHGRVGAGVAGQEGRRRPRRPLPRRPGGPGVQPRETAGPRGPGPQPGVGHQRAGLRAGPHQQGSRQHGRGGDRLQRRPEQPRQRGRAGRPAGAGRRRARPRLHRRHRVGPEDRHCPHHRFAGPGTHPAGRGVQGHHRAGRGRAGRREGQDRTRSAAPQGGRDLPPAGRGRVPAGRAAARPGRNRAGPGRGQRPDEGQGQPQGVRRGGVPRAGRHPARRGGAVPGQGALRGVDHGEGAAPSRSACW